MLELHPVNPETSETTPKGGSATCSRLWGMGLRLRLSEDGASLAAERCQVPTHRQVLLTVPSHDLITPLNPLASFKRQAVFV